MICVGLPIALTIRWYSKQPIAGEASASLRG
jgi:hypothetical protein